MDPALSDRLCGVSLFADLDTEHLRAVAGLVQEFEAEPGHVLVQPGMVGSGLFLIDEGEAVLSLHDHEITLGPGEMVGELALLDDRHVHTTRVKTKTTVKGYCISTDDFQQLLQAEPKIALPMLKAVAKRLVDVITHHKIL